MSLRSRHVGVARDADPSTGGLDVHGVDRVVAEHEQRVAAPAALDDVVAVAGRPEAGVVVVAEEEHVVAAPADHLVLAVAAQEELHPGVAVDQVVVRSRRRERGG